MCPPLLWHAVIVAEGFGSECRWFMSHPTTATHPRALFGVMGNHRLPPVSHFLGTLHHDGFQDLRHLHSAGLFLVLFLRVQFIPVKRLQSWGLREHSMDPRIQPSCRPSPQLLGPYCPISWPVSEHITSSLLLPSSPSPGNVSTWNSQS